MKWSIVWLNQLTVQFAVEGSGSKVLARARAPALAPTIMIASVRAAIWEAAVAARRVLCGRYSVALWLLCRQVHSKSRKSLARLKTLRPHRNLSSGKLENSAERVPQPEPPRCER